MTDMNDKAMRICDNKGFHLDMLNGVTVSVQLGPGNYCDSDCSSADWDAPKNAIGSDEHWGSNTAECAAYITGTDLSWIAVPGYTGGGRDRCGGDDVCGYLNVSQVLDFINLASKLAPQGDYRDDPKLQEDERKIMDEFQQEEDDEDIA